MARITLPELSRRSGVSETSCRRYVRDFAEFLPCHRSGRIALYDQSGAEILKQIKKLYEQGLTADQIREELTGQYPQVVEHDHQDPPRLPQVQGEPTVKDLMTELARAMKPGADNLNFILARLDHLEKRMEAIEKLPWWRKVFK